MDQDSEGLSENRAGSGPSIHVAGKYLKASKHTLRFSRTIVVLFQEQQ